MYQALEKSEEFRYLILLGKSGEDWSLTSTEAEEGRGVGAGRRLVKVPKCPLLHHVEPSNLEQWTSIALRIALMRKYMINQESC